MEDQLHQHTSSQQSLAGRALVERHISRVEGKNAEMLLNFQSAGLF